MTTDPIAASAPESLPPFRGPKRVGPIETLRFLSDPRVGVQRYAQRYGDPFLAPDPNGPVLITGHPDAVREIFTADPDTFDIPMQRQLGPFFGDTSLILTSGVRHKKDRKLLSPPFHGARMRAYGNIILDAAQKEISKVPVGRPFVMMDVTQAISLDVILRAVFGVDEHARREQFREAVIRLMAATASPVITLFEFARHGFGGLGPWSRFQRARAAFDALVFEEIATRREAPAEREDILSLMMSARYDDGSAMSEAELRDQLHLLLFAGHDTTSTALAWAFYWLHRHPEIRQRVLAEIDPLGSEPEPDAIASLPFLDAVCQETLRIHPVAMNIGRLLAKPMTILGREVAAGTTVMISALLLHNREDLYPEPRRFRPERFLERKFSPFELVPFGGGTRRCIGAALAVYEMKLVLAALLREHRFRLERDVEVKSVVRGLTMGPKGGVRMVREGASS